ncbi:unnamed protein product [Sphenostylis stenocarpa]|uniref:Uncharacterized protein n=1 Tax=Sphenostylis stenocarpa TaxID=92480 RepID=A0AA86T716_9FABA|nr:unnamed protein product [Sphenostylis stenocarpa]
MLKGHEPCWILGNIASVSDSNLARLIGHEAQKHVVLCKVVESDLELSGLD